MRLLNRPKGPSTHIIGFQVRKTYSNYSFWELKPQPYTLNPKRVDPKLIGPSLLAKDGLLCPQRAHKSSGKGLGFRV